jgi:serine protease
MNTASNHPRRSVALRIPLQCCSTLLGLILMACSPPAWSADLHPARFIVKWKVGNDRVRTTQLVATREEFRLATGLALQAQHALSDQLDVVQAERDLTDAEWTHALATLRAQRDVEYAVPDERRRIAVLPSDPLVTATSGRSGQWYLLNTQPASINAYDAWDYSQGGSAGSGVVVAVIDTGVRFDHPDLTGKLLPGYDFISCDQSSCSGSGTRTYLTANDGDGWDADASDPGDWISSADLQNHADIFPGDKCKTTNSSWHGTRVAGIIGAATNNSLGIAGIGWNARILPIRALGKCGGYDSDIIAGMRWAAGLPVTGVPANPNPAKVINLSLGSEGSCSQAYTDVIATLTAAGVSVVASAGNDSAIVNAPANCSSVIAVVAVRNAGTKVGFSSLGTAATLAAPGGNCGNVTGPCLYSLDTTTNLGTTVPGVNDYTDQYNANLGTSFSAPIVAGTVALMLGVNNSLTPAQITSTLRSTASAFSQTATDTCVVPTSSSSLKVNETECNCTTSTCGAGIVNAYQAVLAVSGNSGSSSSSSSSSGANTLATTASSDGGGGASSWGTLLLLAGLHLFSAVTGQRRSGTHKKT